ncbi:sensor domain-containing diguanylate cyclase [Nitrogeniibacter mangrovi]|uniref:sensor domain-containing diguanylate cyclase n=1 Tax=Nitrogeniibacter mangrovi TaxID=2016596 RepID=UPI001E2F5DCD|nr:diguanylate cyclase [Nitrogeniibacter mangrovi]
MTEKDRRGATVDHLHPDHNFAVNLMKHLVVPTFVLDAECRVIIWNRACERLTGVRAEEVVGTRRHRLAFYDEDRPTLADLIAMDATDRIDTLYADYDVRSNNDHGFHAENWCVMPRVRTRQYLHIDAGPIFDSDGRLLSVVETLRDMTVQKEAQAELEHLASRDPLTGLANRRRFEEHLGYEWRRGQRTAQPLSMLMIDVDHFKQFNDTYGHPQGDACLRSVAAVLASAAARTGDLASRYGGEEFVLVLPGTTRNGAQVVAERIRAAVAALRIPNKALEHAGMLTVSIGVATGDPGALTQERLVALADTALYGAKHGGRNQVVCAPDTDPAGGG